MMNKNRRKFIKNATLISTAGIGIPQLALSENTQKNISMKLEVKRPKIIFFDVNETLLDLTVMKKSVGAALGGRNDLLPLWFTTMLQYSLVTTVARKYEAFGVIGAAALQMVAANNGIKLSEEEAKEAILPHLRSIPPHPEVKDSLKKLKDAGYTLVSFTNSSNIGVETQFQNAGLINYFDHRLSIEDMGKFKPHTDAYDWAARKMGIQANECMLVAAHGWDIAGAIWAGWRGAFISRPGAQLYPLAPKPELNETDLALITEKLISLK